MKSLLLFTLFILSQQVLAQFYPSNKYTYTKFTRTDSINGTIQTRINKTLGDTAIIFFTQRKYIETSKEGVILAEGTLNGGMGSKCGCDLNQHGYWTTRYRNGHLKSQGKYDCRKKIGTWILYHDNGQIAEIATYKRPYSDALTVRYMPGATLSKKPILSDLYLTYYPNGQLKVAGNYTIVEEHSNTDTVYTVIDIETFDTDTTIVKGDFWNPISKKSGCWTTYAPDGRILSKKNYLVESWKDKSLQSIELREMQILYDFRNKRPLDK